MENLQCGSQNHHVCHIGNRFIITSNLLCLIFGYLIILHTIGLSLSTVKLQQYVYSTTSCDTLDIFTEAISTDKQLTQ